MSSPNIIYAGKWWCGFSIQLASIRIPDWLSNGCSVLIRIPFEHSCLTSHHLPPVIRKVETSTQFSKYFLIGHPIFSVIRLVRYAPIPIEGWEYTIFNLRLRFYYTNVICFIFFLILNIDTLLWPRLRLKESGSNFSLIRLYSIPISGLDLFDKQNLHICFNFRPFSSLCLVTLPLGSNHPT